MNGKYFEVLVVVCLFVCLLLLLLFLRRAKHQHTLLRRDEESLLVSQNCKENPDVSFFLFERDEIRKKRKENMKSIQLLVIFHNIFLLSHTLQNKELSIQ